MNKKEIAIRNRKRGKRTEARIEKETGDIRVGTLGATDLAGDVFCSEIKSRKAFVGAGWMKQAIRNTVKWNKKTGKNLIPIVQIHVLGKRYKGDYILIRREDFERR